MKWDRGLVGAYVLLILVMALWAGNGIAGRAVRFDVGPFTFAFGRWLLAVLFVMPFAIGPLRADWNAILRHWKYVGFMGVIGVGLFNAFIYKGLQQTTATNALLLSAALPALVALFERLLFAVRPGRWRVAGVVLSVIGVALIAFEGDLAAASRLQLGRGDLHILCGVALWSLYTVLLRLSPSIAPVSFIGSTFLVGLVCMAPLAAWEWSEGAPFNLDTGLAGAFLYVALFPSLFCFFVYNWAARRVGAVQAGQVNNLLPVFGALLASMLLGETLHLYHLAGIVVILAGIAISAMKKESEEPAGAP